ncbi:MAG: 1-deoxy-D-xylulose-5-phosphate synthase, partial [Armatimonadetes bacterium]|nr:1-deoxy-D-xylulose-5-phosphate synthase [Armatimonadota bacterium]
GHNIAHMSSLFRHAVRIKGPVLVHLVTQKGRGYEPAEDDPRQFHGTGPFLPENGETVASRQQPTFSEVFGQTVCELAEDDERIVAISAAMLDGTGLDQFKKLFPGRCFDVGMAEEHAVTYAAGLAAAGMRPIVAIYSTFLQRSYDQIVHDVALQSLPVVFAVDRAGIVDADGPTHHGLFDLSYLRHIPNMTVIAPSDEAELRRMLATALTLDSPAALRYPRGCGPGADWQTPLEPLPVGKAKVCREGIDIAVIAVGNCVSAALEAAEVLGEQGIDATAVDARFVKPLDEDLIISLAQKIGAIITVEDNVRAGGFGSAVAELLNDCGLDDVRLVRLGIPDEFVTFGDVERLRADVGIDTEAIVQAAAKVCRGVDIAYVSK